MARPLLVQPSKGVNDDELDRESLRDVCGGNGLACTPNNPTGAAPQTSVTNVRDASGRILTDWAEIQRETRPIHQKVNDAYNRAMAPWNAFDNLFGGLGVGAPRSGYRAP